LTFVETLGIQREHRVCLRGITNPIFAAMVISRVDYPPSKALNGRYDVIVHQVDSPGDLIGLPQLAKHLEASGYLWILHPTSGAAPDDAQVRLAGIAAGFVPGKTLAYSATHAATRYAPRVRVVRGTI
jgi:hypothetical protein